MTRLQVSALVCAILCLRAPGILGAVLAVVAIACLFLDGSRVLW